MATRQQRERVAKELAQVYDGVAHRRDLRRLGIGHDDIRTEQRSGRWTSVGKHTIVVGGLAPTGRGALWQAVWESGSGAVLDGAAALIAAGMKGFTSTTTDVAILVHNRHHRVPGVRLHRRREVGPTAQAGIPRTSPDWACIRAAQWAVSNRQAALLVCLPVQQRMITPKRLAQTWSEVLRSPRRQFLDQAIALICDGAHSLGELDFARLCRRYGLPEPTRQEVRRGNGGRVYLDAYFADAQLVVEIDGAQHGEGLNPVDDALRQNSVTLVNDRVLRIPLLGLLIAEADFMSQVKAALLQGTAP